MKLAAIASHAGSVLQSVIDACADGRIGATVVLVISNNSRAGALQRAQEAGIATAHLSSVTHPDAAALDRAMLDALVQADADCVLLSGYMKPIGPAVLKAYEGRLLNTHPSLLPRHGGQGFYGRRVHEAVLRAGDTETGATLHQVEAGYDSGAVVAQARVTVLPNDTAATLEERVKSAEREMLVTELARIANAWATGMN